MESVDVKIVVLVDEESQDLLRVPGRSRSFRVKRGRIPVRIPAIGFSVVCFLGRDRRAALQEQTPSKQFYHNSRRSFSQSGVFFCFETVD